MLSFLYRLVRVFRDEHGYPPNVVVMNAAHYGRLAQSLPDIPRSELAHFLRLDILVSDEAVHPHMAWMPRTTRRTSAIG